MLWTEETKTFDFSFEASDYAEHLDKYECPVEEYHQHLYGMMWYGMGTITEELESFLIIRVVEEGDAQHRRSVLSVDSHFVQTPVVVKYPEQDYEMMKELDISPTIFCCINMRRFEEIARGNDFKLLVLSVKDEGDYYLVDEKLITYIELPDNADQYPFMPNELGVSSTYQPKTNYRVNKGK